MKVCIVTLLNGKHWRIQMSQETQQIVTHMYITLILKCVVLIGKLFIQGLLFIYPDSYPERKNDFIVFQNILHDGQYTLV